jgi:hypothetical protein
MDINDDSIKTINLLFKGFYFKFILNLLYILIVLVILFIFLIPILLLFESINSTLYATTNDSNILVSLLLKYKLTMYNWCNLDIFMENTSNYFTYNFYTPVVIIYYASMLIYITILIAVLHFILIIIISLLFTSNLGSILENDLDFKKEGIKLMVLILLFIILWACITKSFEFFILKPIRTAVDYNNNINDFMNDTINNKNIFPLSKKKEKEAIFDDIIDRRVEPILVMQNYYEELESFQFKNFNDRARFLILYVILEYIQYVNNIIDSAEYREKIKKYLLNPLDNKDLFISFTLHNYPIKDFIIAKIQSENYLIDNIFKIEMSDKEKLEIKIEYKRILNEELNHNLKKTKESLDKIEPYGFAFIILIIVMFIIIIAVYLYKNPDILDRIKTYVSNKLLKKDSNETIIKELVV